MSRKKPRRKPGSPWKRPSRLPTADLSPPSFALPRPVRHAGLRLVGGFAVVLVVAVLAGTLLRHARKTFPSSVASKSSLAVTSAVHDGPLTFNRDIAPLVFEHCAGCHRAGQAAPFSLLSYADVRKRSRSIVDVIQRRYMPPWLPEKGYGEFAGERRLTDDQIDLIRRWVAQGAMEGKAEDLPAVPRFDEGWRLGQPDFVMTLPQPYNLQAEGKDVYRNFVVPIPLAAAHYIKGIEFLPSNARVLHHAFIDFDETRTSRRRAAKENPPGFDGMELPETAQMPAGQLMGWQPGKTPYFCEPGLSWLLRTNTDLVLQLHMHPSGKPETVRPSIGFYFTDEPPTNSPFRIGIKCFTLDIPAGDSAYVVEESYTLPVGVTLLRVSPHAHYLAKEMQGYAILPDGEKKWLIWIKDWDFNWQGDYEFAHPQVLPAGARLVMHYTYDNSTNNVRNPSNPPRRVRFGLQTTDEMGELWFQSLTRTAEDRERLARDYYYYVVERTTAYDEASIRLDPSNAEAHARLGHNFLVQGKLAEAASHLNAAVVARPDFAQAHYDLAMLCLTTNNLPVAYQELLTVLRLDPSNSKAYGNLGYIESLQGKMTEARAALEKALQLDPDDSAARDFLSRLPGGHH
jgi:mono/diheme cytochrome c family protein